MSRHISYSQEHCTEAQCSQVHGCSVKTYQGLKNVFDETVAATLTYDHPRKKKTLFDHFWKKSSKKKVDAKIQADRNTSDEDNLELDQMLEPSMVPPIIKVVLQPAETKEVPGQRKGTEQVDSRSSSPVDMQRLSPAQSASLIPTMGELLAFRSEEGVISIPEEINAKYKEFGALLLEGDSGSQIEAITADTQDPVQINIRILAQWLAGGGKSRVSWLLLADVLECIDLASLSDLIRCRKIVEAGAVAAGDWSPNFRHSIA